MFLATGGHCYFLRMCTDPVLSLGSPVLCLLSQAKVSCHSPCLMGGSLSLQTQAGPVCCCTWPPRSLALGCHFIRRGRITPLFCGLSTCSALCVGKVLQGLLAVSPLIYLVLPPSPRSQEPGASVPWSQEPGASEQHILLQMASPSSYSDPLPLDQACAQCPLPLAECFPRNLVGPWCK